MLQRFVDNIWWHPFASWNSHQLPNHRDLDVRPAPPLRACLVVLEGDEGSDELGGGSNGFGSKKLVRFCLHEVSQPPTFSNNLTINRISCKSSPLPSLNLLKCSAAELPSDYRRSKPSTLECYTQTQWEIGHCSTTRSIDPHKQFQNV